MSTLLRISAPVIGALLGMSLLQAPAQASSVHVHCKGTAIKRCVKLSVSKTQIRATAKIDDRRRGAVKVAAQQTRVQYYGWDKKWHTYAYVAGDYDGWKGNYDSAGTPWREAPFCQGQKYRAVSVFKWKIGSKINRQTLVTSVHTGSC